MTTPGLLPTLSLLTALLAAACAPPGDASPRATEETGHGEHRLSVRPGEPFARRGVRVIAPQPRQGIFAEVIGEDGTTSTLHLRTSREGVVFLVDDAVPESQHQDDDVDDADDHAEGDAAGGTGDGEVEGEEVAGEHAGEEEVTSEQAGEAGVGSAPGPCKDRARAQLPFRWNGPYAWKYHAASTPGSMSRASVETKLRRAANNITSSRNSCGLADQVSATNVYVGRTAKGTNIGADGSCKSTDGMNSVGFGDLPQGVLGVACVWYSDGVAVEGDVRFNKVDHRWYANTPSSCSGRYSLEAVATHEMGHVFGLTHVGESGHGNLTMSPQMNGACQNAEATLGRGDVIGLRAKY